MAKRVVLYVCAALLGAASAYILSGIFMFIQAEGSGMEPELKNGSGVLINRLAFDVNGKLPETGDVIAFKSDVY